MYSHVGNRFQAAEQQRLGQQQPTGTLTLVDTEKDVMDMTTAHAQVVVHFAHRDFKRCRIMDAHLQVYNYIGHVCQAMWHEMLKKYANVENNRPLLDSTQTRASSRFL